MKEGNKVLFYDIETAPNLAAVWGIYEQNAVWVETEWHTLSFAYKWGDENKIRVVALPDFPLYKKDPENDLEVVKKLHELFNKAQVVVAHNGVKFDHRIANARFIYHNLTPPPPIQEIDTLKVARKYFKFNSNKLEDLAIMFGYGRKTPRHDASLWQGCMRGDRKSWRLMKKYNAQDVRLLGRVYYRLRPWIQGIPRTDLSDTGMACPKCSSKNLQRRGFQLSKTMTYQRYQCNECGSWCRLRLPERDQERRLLVD